MRHLALPRMRSTAPSRARPSVRAADADLAATRKRWLVGIAGPLFAANVKDFTGSFSGTLPVVAAVLLLATALPLITKKPLSSRTGCPQPTPAREC